MLETQFVEVVENHPELIARHYSQSGAHTDQAVEYWRRAANMALSRGANVEAVSQLGAALEGLAGLEASTKRDELELDLRTMLGPAITITRGYTNPQVRNCYARAQALCAALGEERKLAFILRWQHSHEMIGGNLAAAASIATQLVAVVERQGDVALRIGGYVALVITDTISGRFKEALEQAERGVALFDPAEHRIDGWPGGQPGEQCRLFGGVARWLTGKPDTALHIIEGTLDLLRDTDQRFTHALVLTIGALVPLSRGEVSLVETWAQASVAICREESFEFWLRFNECLLAWIEIKKTPSPTALERFERGLASYEASGSRLLVPVLLMLLVECHLDAGDIDRGLTAAERGLFHIEQTNERWMEAELHRLRAELVLLSSPARYEDAEASLGRACAGRAQL